MEKAGVKIIDYSENQCWNDFDLDLYSEMFGEPCSL
jgi:hypothetical protein